LSVDVDASIEPAWD